MLRAALILLFLALASPAGARFYMAALDQSAWKSQADGALCHLSHPVPGFGTALFSQNAQGDLTLSVYSSMPALAEGRGRLLSRTPAWQPPQELELEAARIRPDGPLLQVSAHTAMRLLRELEDGRVAVMEVPAGFGEPLTQVGLSPVRFRPGLREHLGCLARLNPRQPRVQVTELTQAVPAVAAGASGAANQSDLKIEVGRAQPAAADPGSAGDASPDAVVVYFATANAGLTKPAMETLRALAGQLRDQDGEPRVVNIGYADPRGGTRYNQRLSLQRARAVRDYLVALGVKPALISVQSKGEAAVADPRDPLALAAERRVVVEVTASR